MYFILKEIVFCRCNMLCYFFVRLKFDQPKVCIHFLVYVNEISRNIKSFISLFVADTVLSYSSQWPYDLHSVLSSNLNTLQSCVDLWSSLSVSMHLKRKSLPSGLWSRKELEVVGGVGVRVGFLSTLVVGVGFFSPTPTPDSNWIIFYTTSESVSERKILIHFLKRKCFYLENNCETKVFSKR